MTSITTTIISTITTMFGSHTVILPSLFYLSSPLGKAQKCSISCFISKNLAKKKQVINTFNPVGLLFQLYAKIIKPSFLPSIQNICNSLSFLKLLTKEKESCAQDMASLIFSRQAEKDSKKWKTSTFYNYFLKYSCNSLVPRMQKKFVENKFLVTLCEVLYYLAVSKLGDFEAYLEHKIKYVFKLQLQKNEEYLNLITLEEYSVGVLQLEKSKAIN